MKIQVLKYFTFLVLLAGFITGSNNLFGQTVNFTARTNVINFGVLGNNSPLYYTQTGLVLYGFSAAVSGSALTVNEIHLSSTISAAAYFTNGKIYRVAGNNSYAGATQIAGAGVANTTVSITATGVDVTGIGLADPIAKGASSTYYLVADYTVASGALPANIAFNLATANAFVQLSPAKTIGDANGGTSGADLGNKLVPSLPLITQTNLTGGLTTPTALTPSQTNIAMFGFSLNVTGLATVNTININSTNTSNLPKYFTNGKLYRSAGTTFNPGSPGTQVGTVTFSGNFATITGLTEAFTNPNAPQTNNYFLVADYGAFTGTVPGSVTFKFTSGQAQTAVVSTIPTTNPASPYNFNTLVNNAGQTYTLNATGVVLAGAQNGLSGTTVYNGQTAISMFGFGVTVTGVTTITGFNINTTTTNLPASTYLSNLKLYRSTVNTFNGTAVQVAGAGVAGTSVTFSGAFAAVTGLNESYSSLTGQTLYYFLVGDDSYTGTASSKIRFLFTNAQASPALVQTASGTFKYAFNGLLYTFDPNVAAFANVSGGLQSNATSLIPGTTNMPLFGFRVNIKGVSTITQFNITNTNGNLQGYFGNGKLYRSNVSAYDGTAVQIAGAGVAGTSVVFNNSFVNITGLNEIYNVSNSIGQTYYYYLVADYSVFTGVNGTVQFEFTKTQSPTAAVQSSPVSTTFNPTATVKGFVYKIGTTIDLAAASPPGIPLIQGYTDVPMFGFKATVTGPSTITTININSNNASLSSFFANGKFYRSTSPVYDGTAVLIAGASVAGTAVTFNTSYVNVTGLNEVFTGTTPQVYYYYFTADYFYGGAARTNVRFNFKKNQASPAIVQSSPFARNYNTYAMNESTFQIGHPQNVDWIGTNSSDWTDAGNWFPNVVPGSIDKANFGVDTAIINPCVLATTDTVGMLIFGNKSGPVTLTVNKTLATDTLFVTGNIVLLADTFANNNYTHTITGNGAINANNVNVNSNFDMPGVSYTSTLNSSITRLNAANINLISSTTGTDVNNSVFNVTGGVTNISGLLLSTNGTGNTSVFGVMNGTLQFLTTMPFTGLSATGVNTLNFVNTGSTIEYAGPDQTVYTDAVITGLPSGVSYQNLKFSGTGVKTVTGGNLNIAGDFINTLANDATDFVDFSNTSLTVNFNGTAAQTLNSGVTPGQTLYNATFSGTSTKTLAGFGFTLSPQGILTMAGSSSSNILAANGLLTLISDVTGSATVAAFNGPQITGNVNVQRFITGGTTDYRGYRLLSSAVNNGSGIYSVNYLKNSCYLSGATGIPGGFDVVGNPTLYLFRENMAPSNISFISGNYRGIGDLSASPSYSILGDAGTYNIPVGNGFLFFFRGDRSTSLASKTLPPYPAPENTTLSQTGILNQGQILVSDWYTPAYPYIGFTTTAGNGAVQGFNLVGNPYASSIDWDTYNGASSTTGIYAPSVAPFLYILDPLSKNYNVYQSGHGGAGSIVAANSNVIPSGQGFFVQATDPTAQLIFNESAKTNAQATAGNGNLLLGKPVQASVIQYMHLMLMKDSVNKDGIILSFNSSAQPGYVLGEDALYRAGNGSASITSMTADKVALAINTMPLPKQSVTIPLSVNTNIDGIYKLNMTTIKSIPEIYEVWLMDAYKKDSLDMKNNPVYSFNIYKADTNSFGANRFTLVIRQNPALSVHLLNFTAAKTTGGSQVIWKTENEENYTNFTIERSVNGGGTFDVVGGLNANDLGTYSITDKNPVKGADMYRLKIQDLNGAITYSKIVTLIYGNGNTLSSNISVFPNPSTDVINLAIASNSSTSVNGLANSVATFAASNVTYSIKIIDAKGTVIKTATSTQPNWQASVGSLLPGTYIIQVTNITDNSLVGKGTFIKM